MHSLFCSEERTSSSLMLPASFSSAKVCANKNTSMPTIRSQFASMLPRDRELLVINSTSSPLPASATRQLAFHSTVSQSWSVPLFLYIPNLGNGFLKREDHLTKVSQLLSRNRYKQVISRFITISLTPREYEKQTKVIEPVTQSRFLLHNWAILFGCLSFGRLSIVYLFVKYNKRCVLMSSCYQTKIKRV